MTKLEIPLSQSPYTKKRPKITLTAVIILATFAISWCSFRLFTYKDTTSHHRPQNTLATIQVYKTKQTTNLINQKIGHLAAIPGEPWTFQDILNATNKSFSIHITDQGITGITVDTSSSQTEPTTLFTSNQTKTETITPQSTYTFKSLFPQTDAILKTQEKNQTTKISISNNQISLKTKTETPNLPTHTLKDANIFSNIYIDPKTAQNNNLIPQLLQISPTDMLFSELSQFGAFLQLGTSEGKTKFLINIPSTNLQTEDLAKITKSALKTTSLATVPLTITDKITVQEIKTNNKDLNINIQNENNTNIITATSSNGNKITAIKTQTNTLLTNGELTLDKNQNNTTCTDNHQNTTNMNALTAITLNGHQKILAQATQIHSIKTTEQINVSSKNLTFCW